MAGKILICDAVGSDHALVRRLHERLRAGADGYDVIVHDLDTPSDPRHAQGLRRTVGQSDVVIAVIAERDRLDAAEGRSGGWLRSPQSFLRIDLEEALKLKRPVVAVLLGRAPLPRPKDLPRALRSLASHPTVNLTQAGFDGSADRIVRLVRQALGGGTSASSSTGTALEIPVQGYGPHFEIDQDGVIKFAPPAALDRQGNNVDRLRRMHPTLRELSQGLVEALGRGNAPHSYLHERSKTYNDMIDRELEEIDFALLYMEGLRLANAEKAVSGDGELPPLDAPVRERLDSLLQLHGTFILASRDGLEAYEAEQRYRRNQQQETDYRSAAVDFANSLQGRPEVVDPSVASAALNAAEEIGRGGNPERSGTVATGVLGNLTVTLSVAAAVGTLSLAAVSTGSAALIAMAMAAGLVATEGLKKSQSFVALSRLVTQGIDHVGRAELKSGLKKLGDRFRPQLDLFRSAEKPLSKLSSGREEFAWLGNVVGWIEGQMNTEPMAPAVSSPSAPSLPEPQPPTRIGNIYLAKVVRVEPTLECAFVEFGGAKHGFLAFNEIHPDYYQIPVEQRRELVNRLNHVAMRPAVDQLEIQFGEVDDYDDDEGTSIGSTRAVRLQRSNLFKIQDVIKRRQVMLVKVTKDEVENKGAVLTTFISISRRFLVLMPNTAMQLRVSGSIPSPEDRLRLTQLDLDIPEGMGVFMRSTARNIPEAEIVDEFADLVRTWEAVRDTTLRSQAPALVYDATNKLVPPG